MPVTGVSDGDTIKVDVDGSTERVRLIGIDTPELQGDQCYAQEATDMMRSLAQGSVRLEADPAQDDRDRYGRLLRHVFLEDGRNAAEVMIAGGYGREYTYDEGYRYQAEYRAAEDRAREGGDGLWGACGGFDTSDRASTQRNSQAGDAPAPTPERASGQAAPAAPDGPASGGCEIKGNINAEGEKIYHVPGGRSYDKTSIDEGEGERWFCSAAEAEGAGWRAARG